MADVFLSYARSDGDAARTIADRLRASGVSVWFDEQLPAHRPYSDIIEEQLEQARAVLVLWSAAAVQSQWVRSEANRGRELGRLVQLRLDDARLPMPFDQIQCADLNGWRSARPSPGWSTVTGSIAQLTGHAPSASPPSRPGPTRRTVVLAGGATAVIAAGGYLAWRQTQLPPLSPEAQLLLQKGLDALQANDALDPEDEGSTAQAIALLTEATGAAPTSSLAWGGLSLAYAVRRRAAPVSERSGLATRGAAAAATALKLDPREARALAAQRLMAPTNRHWSSAEEAARQALAKNPRFPILLFVLSDILGSVGRWRDATNLSDQLDRTKFLLPGAERKVIINLWAAGDLQAADEAVRAAAERWPDQRQVWRTRIAYLMYSGRASEALASLEDKSSRPMDVLPDALATVTATARALAGETGPTEAIAANLRFARANPERALTVAQAVAALGDTDETFRLLDGYYFAQGDWSSLAPAGGDADRQTAPLFLPPMRPLWRASRFAGLLERIGLEAYWRESGTRPDFRTTG